MKAVIQRVARASVEVEGREFSSIGKGTLVLVGVEKGDTTRDASWLAAKITQLRIFEDDAGKMNLSIQDIGGTILAVSQFTLAGNCNKGRRPSFDGAATPEMARNLFDCFIEELRRWNVHVETGKFQADMQVSLVNDGPVTFVLESPRPGSF